MKVVFLSKNCRMVSRNDEEAPGDGDQPIMVVDLDRCIACGSCKIACQLENRDRNAMQPGTIAITRLDGSEAPLQLNLPLSCRHCDTPCGYHDHHSFWITCPVHVQKKHQICDSCEGRLKKGYMPACATRCSMKCIYICSPHDLKFPLMERRLRGVGDINLNEVV